jgi:hypothetical protein
MLWYRSNGDGTADAFPDSLAIRARVDADKGRDWYMSPVGLVRHAGVRACSFRQYREQLYSAMAYLESKQLVPMGERIVTVRED